MGKGQVSTELAVVFGFILIFMLPILFSVYFKISESSQEISISQADFVAGRLARTVNMVGTLGEPSSIVAEVHVRAYVSGIRINSYQNGVGEIVFIMSTSHGDTEIVKKTDFPVTGEGRESEWNSGGTYYMEVAANQTDGMVHIRPFNY